MFEKISDFVTNAKEVVREKAGEVKEFVSDNSEELLVGFYLLFMLSIGVNTNRYLAEINKQAKIETAKQSIELMKSIH